MAWIRTAWIRNFCLDPELGKFKAGSGSGSGINCFGSTTLVRIMKKLKFKNLVTHSLSKQERNTFLGAHLVMVLNFSSRVNMFEMRLMQLLDYNEISAQTYYDFFRTK